jgi:hypothetical protein
MPTLPLEFQIPEPGKNASPETVSAVELAYVAAQFVAQPVVMVPSVEVAFANVCLPVHELMSASKVEEAVPSATLGRQVPLTAKHPPVRLMPCDPVEVAVRLNLVKSRPPTKVEVADEVCHRVPTERSVEVALAKFCLAENVLISESAVEDAAVIVMLEVPSKEVPLMVRAVWSAVAVEALPVSEPMNVVNQAVVPERSVVDAFANWFKPVHELTSESAVEDAAVMVMEPAAASEVPLIVPREPVRRLVPIEVVATTRPFWSVARSAEAREVMCKLVVVAFTASVEDAMSCVPLSQRGVVVDWFAVPAYEEGANGHAPPPPPPVWSAAQPNLPAPS